ncbi:unnamed protein product [Pedinophyceae sp. YPF-701]|nr:unnamed protein product [Pedinophyceae sp. YPF-701]
MAQVFGRPCPPARLSCCRLAGRANVAAGRRLARVVRVMAAAPGDDRLTQADIEHLLRAAQLSDENAGITGPHPNAACVIVGPGGEVAGSASQRANGAPSAEVLATRAADGQGQGGVAYVNLEPGDCHGEAAAVRALLASGVSRVVVGMRHPMRHSRGEAIAALRGAGLTVSVLGEAAVAPGLEGDAAGARKKCLRANEALLLRAWSGRPFSVLKYAMTLDGKIATASGHAAWVSSAQSRAQVFDLRGRSAAVIVGGNTVRRDNPRLTTRREGGHCPVRIVLSRTLDLPRDANLWDVTLAPTIVMTQRGTRKDFQEALRARGVEVVEFDFLTPGRVSDYCTDRGFLRLLWECGGTLSAPAIQSGVIHRVTAFVAPKIIGGDRAPTPCGDMGFVEMTQALHLVDTEWGQVGPDLKLTGYVEPACPGLEEIDAQLDGPAEDKGPNAPLKAPKRPGVVEFYKPWDANGALNNFTPHPITMPAGPGPVEPGSPGDEGAREWPSVEHYYQAQKFAGVAAAEELVEQIWAAYSPEEAARIGRAAQRSKPELMREDWFDKQLDIMYSALRAKYATHEDPRKLLLSTGTATLVEASPHDFFWGRGRDGSGKNMLGTLLMRLRGELGGS